MARDEIPVLTTNRDGVTITPTTGTANNMKVLLATNTILRLTNTSGSSRDVTFLAQATVDGQAIADRTVTVAAGDSVICGVWLEQLDDGTPIYALPDDDLTDPGYMYIDGPAGNETDIDYEAYTPA